MEKINWCGKINNGIKLVQPSEVISEEYMRRSRESFEILRCIQKTLSMMWLATTKYYTRYFAIYAIMRKLGIKSEIHNCTIAVAEFLEKENILKQGVTDKLKKDKELRIENQYYLKENPVNIDLEELSEFFIQINQTLKSLTKNKIKEIRDKLILILED
ncbi:MAG: hypothetical protein KKA65_02395 [Nanoarchaeota archaeon]|nr:hypothetical protein [Nanoarchaeota archaeon]MBU4456326.1 hypothetical protein [Nanoarchaeota archaeon]MCG2719775.1 hypothetical protein [Nanoarchaeota archaeon]